jgi:hypothetical protein
LLGFSAIRARRSSPPGRATFVCYCRGAVTRRISLLSSPSIGLRVWRA